jgi:hypothetical protein
MHVMRAGDGCEFLRKASLADAWLACDEDDARLPGTDIIQRGAEDGELCLPANEPVRGCVCRERKKACRAVLVRCHCFEGKMCD